MLLRFVRYFVIGVCPLVIDDNSDLLLYVNRKCMNWSTGWKGQKQRKEHGDINAL